MVERAGTVALANSATILGFRQQMRTGRLHLTARAVHAAGAILHRNSLRAARLLVDLDAAETGQDVGYLAMDKSRPVELGQDLDRQPQLSPGRIDQAMFGDSADQIATEQNHGPDVPVDDFFAGFDGVDALLLRHVDAEQLLELFGRHLLGLFGDADCPLALHIGMTAHRADAGAGAADIAAHQSEVDQGLDSFNALLVLGQAHAIDEHDRFRVSINRGRGFKRAAGKPGPALDLVPFGGLDGSGEPFEPAGCARQ